MRRAVLAAGVLLSLQWITGCGGHEARTLKTRTALDAGNAKGAIAALNEEMDVKQDTQLPKDMKGDDAILVLDRASIQQSLLRFKLSQRDFEAADKAIDMLDLARNAGVPASMMATEEEKRAFDKKQAEKAAIENALQVAPALADAAKNAAQADAMSGGTRG